MMETIRVNMTPCEDIKTIHASQNDGEAREWGFILHNNGDVIDSSEITDQMVFKAYKGGTEQILPENGGVPVTAPFNGDIEYPQGLLADQEFTYRQSPTESDGLAKITDIKGNTLVWNQLIQNGNFADTSNWSSSSNVSITASNNILRVTNAVGRDGDYYSAQNIPMKVGHKYYFHAEAKKTDVSTAQTLLLVFFGEGSNTFAIDAIKENTNWVSKSTIFTCASNTYNFVRLRTQVANATNEFRNVVLIDLTQMGLDITSADEFDSLFPKPYYDYCQGAMLSFGGRNVKFNQLVQNGNFADSSNWVAEGSATINSITNNTINVTTANAGNSGIAQISFPMTNGHQYLLVATIKTTGQTNISVSGLGSVLFNTNSFVTKSGVFTWTAATGNQWSARIRNFDANSATFEARNVMLIDLTEMFGVGNEPSAEGFKELFPNDYYEYTTGQYMNLGQPVSLKTTGKNLFTGAESYTRESAGYYIREGVTNNPLPLKLAKGTYTISIKSTVAGTSQLELFSGGIASSDRFLAPYISLVVGVKKYTFTIDKQSDYIRLYGNFVGTLSDIQIEYGSTATDYEPYTESTISIPLDEFPNGMDGINDVRDEKNETGYVKRIGQVDLGTLTYTYTQSSLRFEAQMPSNYKIPTSVSDRENMICAKYSTNPNPLLGNGQEGITGYQNSNKVFISDDQSIIDPAVFKTMMNGVILYYELVTPLENYGVVDLSSLVWTYSSDTSHLRFYTEVINDSKKPSSGTILANIICNKYQTVTESQVFANTNIGICLTSTGRIMVYDPSYSSAEAFKQAMQGVYLLYEKENPQGFTTASLVTENAEIPLSNDDGVLIGKCTEELSSQPGFIDAKIKLTDGDGDCYSNKIQLHVERKPS